MRLRAGRVAWLVPLAVVACDGAPPEQRVLARAGGESDVAVVATERIAGETVLAIAAAQGTSLVVARDRAVRDALFAVEARARGREPRGAESALLARALLETRRGELGGPVTDDELAAATRRHWLELDRPEGARVVHVVVLVATKPPPGRPPSPAPVLPPPNDQWERAESVAKAIAEASASASSAARDGATSDAAVLDELRRATATVDARDLKTQVEALEPTAADGRVLAPGGGQYAPEFGAAVSKLVARGDVSAPFRTTFGVHVAILLERTPAVSIPIEQRRALVRDEVLDGRLAKERSALTAARASTVELATNAAALLDLVSVDGDATAPRSSP